MSPPRYHRVPPGAPGSRAEREEGPLPRLPSEGSPEPRCPCLPLRAHLFSRDWRDARRDGVSSGLPRRGAAGPGSCSPGRAVTRRWKRLREKRVGFPRWLPRRIVRPRAPPGTHPAAPALPRMWTKAPGAHTKFAQGALVGRVGARGRRSEEAGARGAGRAGAWGAGAPRLAAPEGPRGRSRRQSPRLGCGTPWRLGAGLGGCGLSPGSASGPRGREGEGAAAAGPFRERSRAGWGRRSPLYSPISLSCSKSTSTAGVGSASSEVFPALAAPFPLLVSCHKCVAAGGGLRGLVVTRGSRAGILGALKPQEGLGSRVLSDVALFVAPARGRSRGPCARAF